MAYRVLPSEVKNVINTTTADSILTEHIRVASNIVDVHLSDVSLSDETLRNIELYLAAHFSALYAPEAGMANEEQIGSARNRYDYQKGLGEGLKLTRFGAMALMLDTSATLVDLSTAKPKALFRVYGHEPTT